MNRPHNPFQIGAYRPIYLWAGPGTVRMNRLKFMNVAVDEAVHQDAHTLVGAERVVQGLYCNWVHLTYDWGFPPEIEIEDWESFRQAAEVYHQAGSPVFAYFQTSNCVYDGSYRDKDWYALDARGKPVTYFTYGGRYMTCFRSLEWRQNLKNLIAGALERGADGVFLDNLFHGTQPLAMFGAWLGESGCYCERCRKAFLEATGLEIPGSLSAGKPEVQCYLRWRADQVSDLVADVAQYARSIKPGVPIAANDFDPILRNSYLVYGIDLESLARIQDIVMIENYGLPAWEPEPRSRLVNNALTVRTARAHISHQAHLSVLSYDVGIGFDGVYPTRRYLQGVAEAAALGASMTTKGTEYHDGEKMTLLTADEYMEIRQELGRYHRWLETQKHLFGAERRNLAPIGLLYPGERLWLDWHRIAPVYFGAGQSLTASGIPWRVVFPGEKPEDLVALFTFDDEDYQIGEGFALQQKVEITRLLGWNMPGESLANRSGWINSFTTQVVQRMMKAYSANKVVRSLSDRLGLQKIVTQTPLYSVPGGEQRQALLEALPAEIFPRVFAKQPVLIEVWDNQGEVQVHMVNYSSQPQEAHIDFGYPVRVRLVQAPGEEELDRQLQGKEIDILINIYRILVIEKIL